MGRERKAKLEGQNKTKEYVSREGGASLARETNKKKIQETKHADGHASKFQKTRGRLGPERAYPKIGAVRLNARQRQVAKLGKGSKGKSPSVECVVKEHAGRMVAFSQKWSYRDRERSRVQGNKRD